MNTSITRFHPSLSCFPLTLAVVGLAIGTPGLHADDLLTPEQIEQAREWSAKGAIAGPDREQALRELAKLLEPPIARKGVFVWHFDTEGRVSGEPPRSFSGHRYQQDPPKSTPDRWSGAR